MQGSRRRFGPSRTAGRAGWTGCLAPTSLVLAAAALCYAALGAVLRILPDHVGGDLGGSAAAVGLAVGAPARRPSWRGRCGRWADRVGPRPLVVGGAAVMAAGVVPALGERPGRPRRLAPAGRRREGAVMAASVLWLLRLAGARAPRPRVGHIGLPTTPGSPPARCWPTRWAPIRTHVFAARRRAPADAPPRRPRCRPSPRSPTGAASTTRSTRRGLPLRATLRPGLGLALVNVGYVAVIAFGATVAARTAPRPPGRSCPSSRSTVIGARLLAASVPDRVGAASDAARVRRGGGARPGGAGARARLGGGARRDRRARRRPGARRPRARPPGARSASSPPRHGAAAGLFFSWFDAGVGLGGPLVGVLARALSPAAAVALAGGAVITVWPAVVPPRLATTRRLRVKVPGTVSARD